MIGDRHYLEVSCHSQRKYIFAVMSRAITIVYMKYNWVGGEENKIKLNRSTKNGLIVEVILKLGLEKLGNYFQL